MSGVTIFPNRSRSRVRVQSGGLPLFLILTGEMYDRLDSGICDGSRCNAVALSERMGWPVAVTTREGRRLLQIGDDIFPLSESLNQWLSRAERGLEVKAGVYRLQRRSRPAHRGSQDPLPAAA